jgi:hypothetical protein
MQEIEHDKNKKGIVSTVNERKTYQESNNVVAFIVGFRAKKGKS